jgi:nucleotide-binding universal stress UspA family protein/predicted transcriptional regulator
MIAADGVTGGFTSPDVYTEILDAERETATAYLEEARTRLASEQLTVETIVREGGPMAVLLDLADERGAEGIVMATHGRGGLVRAVLGSIARHVVQHATIPVLLVRPDSATAERQPALDRLLVPLDGSTLAEGALDLANVLAKPGSTLILVRVEEADSASGGGWRALLPHHSNDEVRRAATTYLERIAETTVRPELLTHVDLRLGEPTEQILAAARENDADIIVMATHGRTGPARWLLGSVADEVVQQADRPVLLVSARVAIRPAAAAYTVGDVMTREPVTVRESEPLAAVVRKLVRWRLSGVPVVNAGDEPVGVVSANELIGWHDRLVSALTQTDSSVAGELASRLQTDTAGSIMTRQTPAIDEALPLEQASRLFHERGATAVAVTRDGSLSGVLTGLDILKSILGRVQDADADDPSE